MNKININLFVLVLIFITFFSGCNDLAGKAVDTSSSSEKTRNITSITTPNQDNSKTGNNVQISFSLVYSQIVLHQPIILTFSIQNKLEKSISLDLGENFKEGFLFTIIFPDGRISRLPQLKSEGIARTGNLLLKPKDTYTQEILLNEWTEFPTTGKYVVGGQLANFIKTDAGETVIVDSSFSIGIEIQPENAADLKKFCDRLFERLIQSKGYAEAAEAALTLSYVKDPVAVPFLQEALMSNKMVESVIINSLRDRGGAESVEVLIDAMNRKPNSEMVMQAKSALNWIDAHTADATLKAKIKQALSQN